MTPATTPEGGGRGPPPPPQHPQHWAHPGRRFWAALVHRCKCPAPGAPAGKGKRPVKGTEALGLLLMVQERVHFVTVTLALCGRWFPGEPALVPSEGAAAQAAPAKPGREPDSYGWRNPRCFTGSGVPLSGKRPSAVLLTPPATFPRSRLPPGQKGAAF